ncbi:2-oxo acid dehydrogenase subunit E2 [Modestobacter sp. I12A-02628]|uniref:Dihydrolipoamide acetyltransferase component of pyruvate dehydrogenase complex n=1 Tax=Goekera deserti TaxID=2497753 RepID=A0A7K3WG33_9ACTN|nr:2-oxo acid dehydrogenase subunit E2 [Goekera deserti]MPQ96540.1 2-oxo acid dehydrogenase subunit E2 [Goekera deserti]NDI47147.1 2-oxo acid dehydrogenase subunit E2 [Goekera deserti]NEL55455.1 2-oxo acid dehydrogenase subunit E2 [Goekera deserti]
MAQQVLLPKLGLTMEEGTIVEWVARPGDQVRTGDVLLRLGTDKVDADVEAEGEGRFQPVVDEGATLAPGALIAWLLDGDEQPPGAAPAPAAGRAPEPVPEPILASGAVAPGRPEPGGRLLASPNARRVAAELGVDLTTLRGTGPGGRIVSEDVADAVVAARVPAPTADRPSPRPVDGGGVGSPLVRRHAASSGVDLGSVRGSGLGGRIRRADVLAAAGPPPAAPVPAPEAPPAQPAAGPVPGTVLPLTGMRGAIARSMHASLQEMAQLTLGHEADVGGLLALREQLTREWDGTGLRVPTVTDFVVRAAAQALPEHPVLNASVRADGIHLHEQVHVGIAVAVPGGLLVPVLRDADRRGMVDLAGQTRELAVAARAGRLTAAQLEGATFVVTSLGSYGVDFFTPVVNPGTTGILGVGRVRDGVRWEGEVPRRTSVLTLSLSFDHRAVDGAPAAEFLRTVSGLLARPHLLLAG